VKPEAYRSLLETEERHWWFRGRRRIVLDVLGARLARAACGSARPRLLDVGAGGGGLSAALARFGRVVAVESSAEAMVQLRRRAAVTAVSASVLTLPFASGTFDVATALDVLEHVEDDVAAVREIARSLRGGGVFLATVPAHPALWGGHDEIHGHFRRYRPGELESRLESVGFRIEFATPFQTLLLAPLVAQRWLSRMVSASPSAPSTPPPPINSVLEAIFSCERRWVGRGRRLPMGSSHLVYARKASTR